MISPIKASKLSVTSKYGKRTYTYKGKKVTDFHHGIDLIANPNHRNEEIRAVEDGIVTGVQKTGEQYGTGCYVRLKHANGLYTLYYHMRSGTIGVSKGQKVTKGQKLGIIGTTGKSTGVHLHFQIDKGSSSTSRDPYDYVFGNKNILDDNPTPSYSKGNYKTTCAMNVRTGAGTNNAIKKYKDLTADGKKNAVYKTSNANAVYKAGTVFTALEIVSNSYGVWGRSPSGWICIKGASGKEYCKKC